MVIGQPCPASTWRLHVEARGAGDMRARRAARVQGDACRPSSIAEAISS